MILPRCRRKPQGTYLNLNRTHFTASSSPTITSPTQTPIAPASKHSILDDSSIAAVTLQNGDRRVVFQETSGTIRQAIFSANDKSWVAETSSTFQVAPGCKELYSIGCCSKSKCSLRRGGSCPVSVAENSNHHPQVSDTLLHYHRARGV